MIPQRKTESRKAKSVFFRKNNDIDIYVEDTENGTEKLYQILFSKAYHGRYKISKVYPLGGKHEVLKCWRNSKSKARKELYVIDSDFSLASFEKTRDPYNNFGQGLLYTTRFCIENYLINTEASIAFLETKHPTLTYEEIGSSLKYDEWFTAISDPLSELFNHFYCARAISEDIPIMHWNFKSILKNGNGEIDKEKIKDICEEVKYSALAFCSETTWVETYKRINDELSEIYQHNIEYYVCGKNYLLGLLTLKLKSIVKFKDTNILFKQLLARQIPDHYLERELGCII